MPESNENAAPPVHVQGYRVDDTDPELLRRAVKAAVDFRGDVSVTRQSGKTIVGFLFDAKRLDDPQDATLRFVVQGSADRIEIPLADVSILAFTGKDTAAGKSFDTWMRKYVERKKAGLSANIFGDEESDRR